MYLYDDEIDRFDFERIDRVTILVHGTFDADEKFGGAVEPDGKTKWWKPESKFVTSIQNENKSYPDKRAIVAFRWDGENSDASRATSGKRLAKAIHHISACNCDICLVAHSHGGNVILEAIPHFTKKVEVSSITTAGTPFLDYKLSRSYYLVWGSLAFLLFAWSTLATLSALTMSPGQLPAWVAILFGWLAVFWLVRVIVRPLVEIRRRKSTASKFLRRTDWRAVYYPNDEAINLLTSVSKYGGDRKWNGAVASALFKGVLRLSLTISMVAGIGLAVLLTAFAQNSGTLGLDGIFVISFDQFPLAVKAALGGILLSALIALLSFFLSRGAVIGGISSVAFGCRPGISVKSVNQSLAGMTPINVSLSEERAADHALSVYNSWSTFMGDPYSYFENPARFFSFLSRALLHSMYFDGDLDLANLIALSESQDKVQGGV